VSDHPTLDLPTFFAVLRKGWLKLLIIALVAGGAAFGLSLLQKDKYEASADLWFHKSDVANTIFGNQIQDSNNAPERVAATNLALASLDSVARRVKNELNIGGTLEKFRSRVDVAPKGQADIVTITASGPTRTEAVKIANAFAEEVVAQRKAVQQAQLQDTIEQLNGRIGQVGPDTRTGKQLSSRVSDLETLQAAQTGDVQVAQKATPPLERAAPKPKRNAVLGFIVGGILGVFVLLLMHRLDRRVRSEDEVARITDAPILSRLPIDRGSRSDRALFFEAIQFLRLNLRVQDPRNDMRVIVCTSARPGDGKTTVAAGLARALALMGSRVIAVDCDLRKPRLNAEFDVELAEGLGDVLVEIREPLNVLKTTSDPGVRVMTAGALPFTPSSLVVSMQRLPAVLETLREDADYLVIDTPPISAAAEASEIAAAADGVILVINAREARRDVLAAAREQLAQARARLAGVVMNRADSPLIGYEYYGYRPVEPVSNGDVGAPPERQRSNR
jgi:polysaccharide biosynthesis transport protein